MKRIWVDQNDLRPGAKPLVVTETTDAEEASFTANLPTRYNETTQRGREVYIYGPCVLRFEPDVEGYARVWIETKNDVEIIDAELVN